MAGWNIAADKVINTTLKEAGFTLPPDAWYTQGDEVGKSAEWVYARQPKNPPKGGTGCGKGRGRGGKGSPGKGGQPQFDGGALGEFRDAPTGPDSDGNPAPSEQEWKQAAIQAATQAKQKGKLPSSLERLVQQALEPKVDWRGVLRRFMERAASDYSWHMPNRRYVAAGLYLPSLLSHEMPEVAIAVDTSGSIDDVILRAFQAEVAAVIGETNPAAVTVYYADAAVARVDRFERGELLVWKPAGGGGTDFRPVFRAVAKGETVPACLIYLTDLCGTFPENEPDGLPVLWVTGEDSKAPWGETVKMES
jgi:predicted metal-dependent peptidase